MNEDHFTQDGRPRGAHHGVGDVNGCRSERAMFRLCGLRTDEAGQERNRSSES